MPEPRIPVPDDYPLADCGCVYHAEEGIPCPHDVALAQEQHYVQR